jgi:hypothetical protein
MARVLANKTVLLLIQTMPHKLFAIVKDDILHSGIQGTQSKSYLTELVSPKSFLPAF